MCERILWAIGLAVLGAILGSFLATIAVRWPEGRSVRHGRSACDTCGGRIGARDLVPIVSVLLLRGRCRACGAAIDPRHARIEACAALIGLSAGVVAASPEALAGAAFGWLLLLAAALDLGNLWIPDAVTATLALGGLIAGIWFDPPLVDRLIGGAGGFAALWLVGTGYRHVTGRVGLGGADPKLFGAIGLWLGWSLLPGVLTIAALIGLGIALFGSLRGGQVSRHTAVPFGAYLAIAAYPAWLAMIGLRG